MVAISNIFKDIYPILFFKDIYPITEPTADINKYLLYSFCLDIDNKKAIPKGAMLLIKITLLTRNELIKKIIIFTIELKLIDFLYFCFSIFF